MREVEYGFLDKDKLLLEKISPINKISKIKCPLLLEGGENDERVPISETYQMYNAIKDLVPCKLIVFKNEGHGVTRFENKIELYPQISQWFQTYL